MKALAKGIDVSTFQGTINWKKVKNDGIQFAMLRGGYGRNASQVDAKFEINYKNAKAAEVPIGVYHYSYATTVEGAKKEAEFVISYLKGKQFEYPIAYDVEDITQKDLSKTDLTKMVKAFCEAVQKAGYYVCIYTNLDWARNRLNMKTLSAYDVWIAQWSSKCTYTGEYGLWQYSSNGKVNGISGRVDMDYAYKDYPSLIKNAGLNGFKKTSSSAKPNSSTVTKPATKPAEVKYVKGQKITLKNKALYASSTAKTSSTKKSGTYYIYDGIKINGRYRITVRKAFCGKKPERLFVTGWVAL